MSKHRRNARSGGNPFAAKNKGKPVRRKDSGATPDDKLVNADMQAAVRAQNSGDLAEARRLYEKVLATHPDNGYALVYLGTIHYNMGDFQAAHDMIERGHAAGVDDETYYINSGLVQAKFGNHQLAIEKYQKALSIKPDSVEAFFNLGSSYYKIRKYSESAEAYEKALALSPDNFTIEYQLACALQDNQRHKQALIHFQNIHKKQPDDPRVLCGIGMSLAGTYRHREALQYLDKAIQISPDNYIFHFNIANVYKGQQLYTEARVHFEKALELNPNAMEAILGFGRMLTDIGQFEESREYFQRAINLDPGYHSPYSSMGTSYMKNDVRTALEWYDKALAIKPDADDVLMLKGYCYNLLGRLQEAEQSLRQAIELNPDFAEHYQNLANVLVVQGRLAETLDLCKQALLINQSNHRAFSNILLYMHYIPQSSPDDLLLMHKKYNSLFSPVFTPPEVPPFKINADPEKKLRVGFISADFRRHSVSYFIEPLFRNHDRSQVEIFCYASVKAPDVFTKMLEGHSDGWRNILSLSDFEAAEVIRHDRIDILIDLGGHTAENRLPIFYRRPAPLQVSWLGYPDTTGLDCMDYRIVDEITDPPQLEKFSTEKLFRMPGGFHCYGAFPDSPDVGDSPCLENGYITFGSFNNYAKVCAETHYLWAQILKSVPNSRLLLKSLGLDDEYMKNMVYERFEKLGISADRIEVLGKTKKISDHLRTYQRVDIALDTYPYNGTTTTFEALWMGVPVISLSAFTHASLVGKSILIYSGLEDLACDSPDKYVATAKAIAENPELLQQVRTTMRERMQHTPFLDEKGFWTKFHGALRFMWRECCAEKSKEEGYFAEPGSFTSIEEMAQAQNLSAQAQLEQDFTLNFGTPATQPQAPATAPQPSAQPQSFQLNFGANASTASPAPQKEEQKPDSDDDGIQDIGGNIKLDF